MWAKRLGRALRALRHRARLTQRELGAAIGVSRTVIMRIEAGRFSNIAVGTIEAAFAALDASVEMRASWRGAALDRLVDEGHAALVGRVVELLARWGWECRVEVTYARFGERGSIDILAWHAGSRTLLVIELKTELGSIEALLRTLDAKVRLAPALARERFGWHARAVGRLVVFPERMAVRRQLERHEVLLRRALPGRGRDARRWLRSPAGEFAGAWLLSDAQGMCTRPNPSAIRRVRRPSPRSAERGTTVDEGPTGRAARQHPT